MGRRKKDAQLEEGTVPAEAEQDTNNFELSRRRPANAEMIDGYLDGLDLDAPEPTARTATVTALPMAAMIGALIKMADVDKA